MLENYLPVLIFLAVAALLAAVLLGLGAVLGRLGRTSPQGSGEALGLRVRI